MQTHKQKLQSLLAPEKQKYNWSFAGAPGVRGGLPDFFSLLTESKKNEIKRLIGEAVLNILKQITIKLILRK